ncbi:MAG: mechanosensitive ion channel family protein [Bacteroidota bacterium]|nr:mechanosensitive ion channel family protein [Bacteroidota bacterium]
MKLPFLICLISILIWREAAAQVPDSLAAPAPAPAGAAVVLPPADTLFRVYGRVGSFGPKERAEAIERRLEALLKVSSFAPDSLAVVEAEQDAEIVYGDQQLLSVGAAEAQALGQPRLAVAKRYLGILRTHLTAARQAGNLPELLKRGGLAVLTLLMLAGLIYGLNRFFRSINQRILRWRGSPLRPLRINDYELLTQERQLEVMRTALKLLRLALVALTVYLALPLLFSLFPWTEGFSRQLLGYVLGPVQRVVLAVVHYVPNLLTIIVIYFFTTYAVRFLRFLAGEAAAGKLVIDGFYPDWALPTFNLLRFALYVFMFIVIFPYLPGSDSPVFQGVSVLLGFVISFGSTSAIGNVIAGIVITYMRPYKVGDRVKIGDVTGDILEKTLLVTRVRTIKNEDITIPNSNILSGHTVNYTAAAAHEGLILHTAVTMATTCPGRRYTRSCWPPPAPPRAWKPPPRLSCCKPASTIFTWRTRLTPTPGCPTGRRGCIRCCTSTFRTSLPAPGSRLCRRTTAPPAPGPRPAAPFRPRPPRPEHNRKTGAAGHQRL